MLTKDISAELENVLQTLKEQGKEPTVAIVKARLSSPVPMPALIATIKSWKSNHRVPKVEIAQTADSTQDKISQLEAQVKALTARIEALENQENK
ncbi:hypothetical protein [Vibrio genomosp. F6]|uniref:KfrA N-terminal DNA-binding domain-containing protein n=1 Tax=Vibrio genomosp. F6 str. FF-238 TaxID=1191298 RepID=A0A1E5CYP7_9VIBR|nr:hypothetical protein [Vibrio genomosp. F6]OEE75952.1 hypothetical protein A130_15830 [Vibrio genomosp. F6 str. FF-238]TKF20526.1 hypothetical protein FCV43_13530 [Vibrio genomosp. F6]